MKSVLLLVLSFALTLALVHGSNSRRSDGKAADKDTPFWAARGKRTNPASRCSGGLLLKPEEGEEESPAWTEADSSERFYDKNTDIWNARLKRSSTSYFGENSLEQQSKYPFPSWFVKLYTGNQLDQIQGSKTGVHPRDAALLSAWLRLVGKRDGNNGGSGSTSTTDANGVPFWAARG